jgi:hypothetical protein
LLPIVKETPAEKKARLAQEAKNAKQAHAVLGKIEAAIDAAESLQAKPTYYLLHDECTRTFKDLLNDIITMKVIRLTAISAPVSDKRLIAAHPAFKVEAPRHSVLRASPLPASQQSAYRRTGRSTFPDRRRLRKQLRLVARGRLTWTSRTHLQLRRS